MAELVAVVNLLGSIVALVDFGSKIASRLEDFSSRTAALPSSFRLVAEQIPLLNLTLEKIRNNAASNRLNEAHAAALSPVINSTLAQIQVLDVALAKALPHEQASQFEQRIKALKSLLYDKAIAESLDRIQRNIQVLVFHHTVAYIDAEIQILDTLRSLNISPTPVPSTTKAYSKGLNLAGAPLIEEDNFVGRRAELSQLRQWLTPKCDPPSRQAVSIVGAGGMGKTQLSLAYARTQSSLYSSVFWINAKDQSSLRQSLDRVSSIVLGSDEAGSLGIEEKIAMFHRWLSEEENNRWLLIFDNYDDPLLGPQDPSQTAFDLRPYFPDRLHGTILITTRSRRLTYTKQLPLESLHDLEDRLLILAARSGRNIKDDEDACSLAIRLDGLPLALATAGAYLRQTSESCGGYLKAYEKTWSELQDIDELDEYQDRTLFTTYNLSLDQVRSRDQDAAELFKMLAYFDNKDIWYQLIRSAAKYSSQINASTVKESEPPFRSRASPVSQSATYVKSEMHSAVLVSEPHIEHPLAWLQRVTKTQVKFDLTMARLVDYCLVEPTKDGYSLHTCIHDWLLESVNKPLDELYLRAVIHAIGACVRSYGSDRMVNARLLSHARRLQHPSFQNVQRNIASHGDTLNMLRRIAYLWYLRCEFVMAQQLLSQIMGTMESVLGQQHLTTLKASALQGDIYEFIGDSSEAERILRRTFRYSKESLGAGHTLTVEIARRLGEIFSKTGRHADAEEHYILAMSGYLQSGRVDGTRLTLICLGLVNLYTAQSRIDEAEEYFAKAKIMDLDPNHPMRIYSEYLLGQIRLQQGRLQDAEELLEKVLEGFVQLYGPNHLHTIDVQDALGKIYTKQNRLGEAEQALTNVQSRHRLMFGADHARSLSVTIRLGGIYVKRDKLDEAEQSFSEILAIRHQVSACNTELVKTAEEKLAEVTRIRATRTQEKDASICSEVPESWNESHSIPVSVNGVSIAAGSNRRQWWKRARMLVPRGRKALQMADLTT